MNPEDERQDAGAETVRSLQGEPRPCYAPPKLTRFGSLADITRSGGTLPDPDAQLRNSISG